MRVCVNKIIADVMFPQLQVPSESCRTSPAAVSYPVSPAVLTSCGLRCTDANP